MLAVKQNLGPNIGGLAFRIETRNSLPRVAWESAAVSMDANDLLGVEGVSDRSELGEAEDWLRDYLADGAVAARDAIRAASDFGISKTTLGRARRALCRKPRKLGGRGAGWQWELKDSSVEVSKNPSPTQMPSDSLDSLTNTVKTQQRSGADFSKNPPGEYVEVELSQSKVTGQARDKKGWAGPPPTPMRCAGCGEMQPSAIALAHHLDSCGPSGRTSGVPS